MKKQAIALFFVVSASVLSSAYAADVPCYGNGCNNPPLPTNATNGACSVPAAHYSCSAGTLGATAEYPDQWNWWCNGSDGGTNVLCSEMKTPLPPPLPPTLPPPPPPPPPAFNLVGCFPVQYDGNGFIVDDNGSMSPFSPTSQTVCLDPGQVNEDGTQSYQGRVLGDEGSSAYAYYQPNVLPGAQKYLSISLYIPEQGFGVQDPGYRSVTITAFVDQSESYFWGGANAFYVPERRAGDLTPNVYRTPKTFYGASVRGWRNGGGRKG